MQFQRQSRYSAVRNVSSGAFTYYLSCQQVTRGPLRVDVNMDVEMSV